MTYPLSKCRYPNDVKRILRIALEHGVIATALEAKTAWEEYSDDHCAKWLYLSDNDTEVWANLPGWFKGESNEENY